MSPPKASLRSRLRLKTQCLEVFRVSARRPDSWPGGWYVAEVRCGRTRYHWGWCVSDELVPQANSSVERRTWATVRWRRTMTRWERRHPPE